MRRGVIAQNPAELISIPKQQKALPRALTVDDAFRLMDEAAGAAAAPGAGGVAAAGSAVARGSAEARAPQGTQLPSPEGRRPGAPREVRPKNTGLPEADTCGGRRTDTPETLDYAFLRRVAQLLLLSSLAASNPRMGRFF